MLNQKQSLQKMGNDKIKNKKPTEFSTALETPNNFFKMLGLTLLFESSSNFWTGFKSTYFWIIFIGLNVCAISETMELLLTMALGEFKYFIKIIETIAYTGFVVITIVKLILIFIHRKTLSFIIDELRDLFPKSLAKQKKYKVYEYVKRTNYLIKFFCILYMLLIWMFNLLPIGDSYLIYRRTHEWKRQLPFHFWYPFDVYVTGVFELNYLFQIWGGFNAATAGVAVNILFCAIISQICLQLDILQKEMIGLEVGDKSGHDCNKLSRLIQKHERLIQLSNKMEIIFSIPLLFNFFASTFIICLSGFMAMVGIRNCIFIDLIKLKDILYFFLLCV